VTPTPANLDIILNGEALINRETDTQENKMIIAYSLRKINTNPIDAYSTLNPETSSDSPSEKSNGVRLVSAKRIIIHKLITLGKVKANLVSKIKLSLILSLIKHAIKIIIIKARLISYEIVWATPRIDPIKAYFLLEDHPIINRGYTLSLKKVRNVISPKGKWDSEVFEGKTVHIAKATTNIKQGLIKKNFQFTFILFSDCLINNLIASLKGWITPEKATLLGPTRVWENPKIFRSNKVTKATFTRIGINKINNLPIKIVVNMKYFIFLSFTLLKLIKQKKIKISE
jgi:hypothetical protein